MAEDALRGEQGHLLRDALYRRALEVGRRAAGVSGPNPPVGCILVKDGAILAEGSTQPVGGPHAEIEALAAAGERARGSTAIVTLEPCAHHGRTPPCTDALLAAGVATVHVLTRDPDAHASGGLDVLRRSGVSVLHVGRIRDDLAREAAHDLRGFLARVHQGRPHVTLKLAQAPDGSTVPTRGRYLTGEMARRRVHELRGDCDAVLVGGETVRADDPLLDVRHVPAARQPRPVVLTTSGELPEAARAVRPGALIVVAPDRARSLAGPCSARGALVVEVPRADTDDGLALGTALSRLLEHRILTILAEPGLRLARALLTGGHVDTVELHVAGGARATRIQPALRELTGMIRGDVGVERTVTEDADLLLRAPVASLREVHDALEGVT